jgi:hypothetical protein
MNKWVKLENQEPPENTQLYVSLINYKNESYVYGFVYYSKWSEISRSNGSSNGFFTHHSQDIVSDKVTHWMLGPPNPIHPHLDNDNV